MITNQIKLAADILADLTPASPEWEKGAAFNQLLQLRDSRDYFAPKLARYQETGDAEGIRMMSRAIASLDTRIAAAEAKLTECGAAMAGFGRDIVTTLRERALKVGDAPTRGEMLAIAQDVAWEAHATLNAA